MLGKPVSPCISLCTVYSWFLPSEYANPPVFPFLPADMGMCSFISSLSGEEPFTRLFEWLVLGFLSAAIIPALSDPAVFLTGLPVPTPLCDSAFMCRRGFGLFQWITATSALRTLTLPIRMKTNIWQPGARCSSDPCDLYSLHTSWMIWSAHGFLCDGAQEGE